MGWLPCAENVGLCLCVRDFTAQERGAAAHRAGGTGDIPVALGWHTGQTGHGHNVRALRPTACVKLEEKQPEQEAPMGFGSPLLQAPSSRTLVEHLLQSGGRLQCAHKKG